MATPDVPAPNEVLDSAWVQQKANQVFDRYAAGAYNVDDLSDLSRLQAELAAWQGRNFGAAPTELLALGVCEESGELAHAVLKHAQKIRGMQDEAAYKAAVADAAGDISIYLMNLLTGLRLDFGTIIEETAKRVMKRDWKARPTDGGQPEVAPLFWAPGMPSPDGPGPLEEPSPPAHGSGACKHTGANSQGLCTHCWEPVTQRTR